MTKAAHSSSPIKPHHFIPFLISPHHRSSMPPPSPPLLVLVIPTIAFFLWLIANPSFLSTTSHQRVRPAHSIHKSWDSLNIFLVLFAILCGVFARRNDEDSSDNTNTSASSTSGINYKESEEDHAKRSVSNPPSWFDQFSNDRPTFPTRRLKRSSSSYPDLRQESWENPVDEDQRFRFFDDFELTNRLYSSSPSSEYIHHRRNRSTLVSEESNAKEIPVDTFVLRAPPSPSPPPPPPPPPPPREKVYRTIPRKEKPQKPAEKTPPPPPPPPPPRPPPSTLPERKYAKNERKKSNATKEIKIILASLYNQRKRKKKQRNMKKNNINTYDHVSAQPTSEQSSYFRPPPSPPPPPPPPPPPSKFYNLFHKRNHKSKKIHSFSAPPPPPPPPPRKYNALPSTPPRKIYTATGKPPLPTRVNNYFEENVNSGNQSPLMPPPPPPPPFKVQGFRFVVSGDFVRIKSASSSRCGSPDREEVGEITAARGGNGGGASVFCPSPDVNLKADSFIARLKDEWRLEKMNSRKERRVGLSPTSGP